MVRLRRLPLRRSRGPSRSVCGCAVHTFRAATHENDSASPSPQRATQNNLSCCWRTPAALISPAPKYVCVKSPNVLRTSYDQSEFAVRDNKIGGQRIGRSRTAGVTQQQHAPAASRSARGRAALRIGAQGRSIAFAMIGFIETSAPGSRRTAAISGRSGRPVKIDQQALSHGN